MILEKVRLDAENIPALLGSKNIARHVLDPPIFRRSIRKAFFFLFGWLVARTCSILLPQLPISREVTLT